MPPSHVNRPRPIPLLMADGHRAVTDSYCASPHMYLYYALAKLTIHVGAAALPSSRKDLDVDLRQRPPLLVIKQPRLLQMFSCRSIPVATLYT